ncbi:MAG: hypothetical protein A2075_16435 [Geobacteraceae bacterium GWC2_58_44]|nr:MAG: hypothetical protein A2075_16435 [Geobacteraceae bacterium GWC2_58_44]HBG07025.1 hypothetical protein [Geobacter sp.]
MRIVLAGYYGYRNIGDDLMLQNLLALLTARPEVERIDVICLENYYLPRARTRYIPGGWRANPRRIWALARADQVIWGGGTCLSECSSNAGLYWIKYFQMLARAFGAKFSFVGIGIGRFQTPRFAALAGKVLAQSDHVSFREEASLAAAAALPGYRGDACSGGDLVFLDTFLFETLRRSRSAEAPIRSISFSGLHGLDDRQAAHYARQLAAVTEELGAELHFLPAHAGAAGDDEFHRRLALHLPRPERCRFHSWQTPEEYLRVMATMDFHIGMRLHSIICADLLGVPNLAISYAPKVRYYVEKSGVSVERRVIEMGEGFDGTRVKELAASYRRPEYFIAQESHKANKCIKMMFH